MSRSARKATARRIWLTARLILATRGAGQGALNSPRRRRIRERPGRGARQREDEQAEAHPYGLAHPTHQAERDCRRRSEAERGERDHIAALEGAEARRDQERGEADRGAERLDHGGRRQRDGDAQELQDQPGLERAEQPRDKMEGDREDDPPGGGLVEAREHVVDAPERLGMPVLDPELGDEPPTPREHAARLRQDEARERDRLDREEPEHPVEQGRPRQGAGPGQRDAEQQEEALRDRDRGLRDDHGGHARVERDPAAEEPCLDGRASGDGSRSSSQRAQPTSIPSRPRGAWVTSVRNSSLRPRLACEWVRRRPPPTAQRSGKTSAARRERTRPARTIHSKAANRMTSRTNTRCWSTAGYAQLSQNPRGPRGQAPGSSRIMRKTASPRKISGQWRAQRARPAAWRIARSPMASTNSPATLWLNSDHARSAAVLGASRSSTGSSSIAGDESVGHRGVNRATSSVSVARSATTSTAGGSEVSDAATKRVVRPRPNSTSTSRRSRAEPISPAAGSRRTAKKFIAPRVRRAARIATLVSTMMPYAVPRNAPIPPTKASVSASPAPTRVATDVSASAEKRLSSSAGHARSLRPSPVTTRCARPPIHAAAPTWWRPSSASRRPRDPSRAAA